MKQQYIVIKLGTSLTTKNGRLDKKRFSELITQLKKIQAKQIGICLVISGAVKLGETMSNNNLSKSLSAGIGQAALSGELFSRFQKNGLLLAQLLLTKSDFSYKKRREQLANLFFEGAKKGIIFLANENDITQLHGFGGNDFLASEIAKLIHATHLLLLTDVNGVYGKNMELIKEITDDIHNNVYTSPNLKGKGVGGMQAKIQAAQSAAQTGINTIIAGGNTKNAIAAIILENTQIGTRFI